MPSRFDALRSLSRRDLLAAGAGSLLTLGATSALGRPSVRLTGGHAYLHPAADRAIDNGLQQDGEEQAYVTLVADEAPDVAGPDLDPDIRERLETPETDEEGGVFHAIIQTRSTPESPHYLTPAGLRDPYWRGRGTLVFPVTVEEWGSLDGMDDDKREALQSAEELVTTSIWGVTPALNFFPNNVDLAQVHREYVG
ncbi:hypothetical protein ACOZ4N_13850 [Halorientalis pallida]|uniref:hypothetical protein n=1 Tax=Halorientalis pallida TaxID=2479928 RepID=UPI003C703DE0